MGCEELVEYVRCVCVWLRSGGVGLCYVGVSCVSLDSLCRWQVQVSVYCAWRIPAHLRCTQCSILFHLMFPNMYLFIADITNPDSFV